VSVSDRDYWREEPRGWALAGMAPKWLLAGGTALAYVVQAAAANADPRAEIFVLDHLALSVDGLASGEAWQVLTYALLHGDMGHLFWNLVALVMFLWVLEDVLPPTEVYRAYLVGALGGAAGHVLWVLAGLAPSSTPVVGASGAVTAIVVLAAFAAGRKVVFLFAVIPVPIWILGAVYVGLDVLRAILFAVDPVARDLAGVAVQAHLGGAAAGALLHLRPWARRTPRPRAVPTPPREAAGAEEARMDSLLERIHSEGIGALTEEERSFLKRVSERYRGRRG